MPKDKKAMKDYDLGQDKPEQIIEWKLTEDEFDILYKSGLFNKLNEKCNVIIDDFESEVIESEELNNAEKTLFKLQENMNNREIVHLYDLILEAIKNKTLIAFNF